MRVVRDINSAIVATIVALVILAAPVASAANSHACCPPVDSPSASSRSHDLVSHYQHTVQMNHDGLMHNGDGDQSFEKPCDISCCASFASLAHMVMTSAAAGEWGREHLSYKPTKESAASALQGLQTPPPKFSLIA